MIRLNGKIVDADERYLHIRVPYHPDYVGKDMENATVFLHDGRLRSRDQNAKVWALIGEIAMWAGYKSSETSAVNADMKRDFLLKRFDELSAAAIKAFSMGDVDVTTASMYIQFLIDFVLEHNIPTKRPITELCDDIQAAVYSAMMHKRCIVCGNKADLHHIDRVGMGGDRHDMCHIGMHALPLCRDHHQEAHQHGDAVLMDKYHLESIVIDEKIAKKYKLGGKQHE